MHDGQLRQGDVLARRYILRQPVGAGGMSYEEAAQICDCALGTMKSRVSRARTALEEIMDRGQFSQRRSDAVPASEAMDAIMDSVEEITARREAANR